MPTKKKDPDKKEIPAFRTPGVIAASLGKSLTRVQYVLATRDHIRPSATAGKLRLYDREAVAMIRHELAAIDARREKAHAKRRQRAKDEANKKLKKIGII